jgi:uncharacterized protein with PQ loop repeat
MANDVSILVGILVCFIIPLLSLPQIMEIVRKQSSKGVSYITYGVGTLSSCAAFWNAFALNIWDIEMCAVNRYVCINKFLICLQMTIQLAMYFATFVLCIRFYYQTYDEHTKGEYTTDGKLKASSVFVVSLAFYVMLAIMSILWIFIYLFYPDSFGPRDHRSQQTQYLGQLMGYGATLLGLIQWIPQIVKIHNERATGSFNIVTPIAMGIASIGMTLYLSVLSGQHVSVWIAYVFATLQHGVLFVLCLYYRQKSAPALPQ